MNPVTRQWRWCQCPLLLYPVFPPHTIPLCYMKQELQDKISHLVATSLFVSKWHHSAHIGNNSVEDYRTHRAVSKICPCVTMTSILVIIVFLLRCKVCSSPHRAFPVFPSVPEDNGKIGKLKISSLYVFKRLLSTHRFCLFIELLLVKRSVLLRKSAKSHAFVADRSNCQFTAPL